MDLRLLVCGSRDWPEAPVNNFPGLNPWGILVAVLDGVYANATDGYMTTDMNGFTLIEGGAKGADKVANRWARRSPMHSYAEYPEDRNDMSAYPDDPPFEHLSFPAKWYEHDYTGESGVKCNCLTTVCRAAGVRRNKQMLNEGRPDMVLAFTNNIKESRGTKDMVKRAEDYGVPVYVIGCPNL